MVPPLLRGHLVRQATILFLALLRLMAAVEAQASTLVQRREMAVPAEVPAAIRQRLQAGAPQLQAKAITVAVTALRQARTLLAAAAARALRALLGRVRNAALAAVGLRLLFLVRQLLMLAAAAAVMALKVERKAAAVRAAAGMAVPLERHLLA